jgi:hypothetical protein
MKYKKIKLIKVILLRSDVYGNPGEEVDIFYNTGFFVIK